MPLLGCSWSQQHTASASATAVDLCALFVAGNEQSERRAQKLSGTNFSLKVQVSKVTLLHFGNGDKVNSSSSQDVSEVDFH